MDIWTCDLPAARLVCSSHPFDHERLWQVATDRILHSETYHLLKVGHCTTSCAGHFNGMCMHAVLAVCPFLKVGYWIRLLCWMRAPAQALEPMSQSLNIPAASCLMPASPLPVVCLIGLSRWDGCFALGWLLMPRSHVHAVMHKDDQHSM